MAFEDVYIASIRPIGLLRYFSEQLYCIRAPHLLEAGVLLASLRLQSDNGTGGKNKDVGLTYLL